MNDINFLEEFNRLPQPLKELLSSSYLGQTVKDALTLAQIDQKKYDDLMNATSEVLRLHIIPNEFLKLLTSQYNFSEKQAQIINKVINDRIFSQVSSLLKKDSLLSLVKDQQPIKESIGGSPFTHFKSVSQILKIPKTNIPPPISTPKPETIIINKQQPTPENNKQIEAQEAKTKEETKETLPEAKIKETDREIPEIKIPEPLEINIEKPLQHNIEPSPITIPEVPYEKQQKIKETLLKIMTEKKTNTPKIVEEMKKVEKEPKKENSVKTKQEKTFAQISEISEVLSGQTDNYTKKTLITNKKDNETILNIKIKEFQKKEKEEIQEPDFIAYRKYVKKEEKPFGET